MVCRAPGATCLAALKAADVAGSAAPHLSVLCRRLLHRKYLCLRSLLYDEGAVSSMAERETRIEWETKEEVTPEDLHEYREYLKRTIGNPSLQYQSFFNYVTPHMVKAMLMTKADAMEKAEAVFYFGELAGLAKALANIYWFAWYYAGVWKEDFYREVEEKIGHDLQEATEDVIKLYSKIKEGKLQDLDQVLSTLSFDVWELRLDAEEFTIRLGNHIAINYVEKLRSLRS